MKVRLGKQPHNCAEHAAEIRRVQYHEGESFGAQLVVRLDDGRLLWLTIDRDDNPEMLDSLTAALRDMRGRGDVHLRTSIIGAVSQVMGAGAGVTQYEAARVADRAVQDFNARSGKESK